jgi:hypothetical protein
VLYLRLIIFSVGGDISIDSETFLLTDFINLKIKSIQSFEYAHKDKVCVFKGVGTHICKNIYVCTVFLKKNQARVASRDSIGNEDYICRQQLNGVQIRFDSICRQPALEDPFSIQIPTLHAPVYFGRF